MGNPVQPSSHSPYQDLLVPQLAQSFRQLPISLIVNLANGFILAAVLWDVVPAHTLLAWSGLLVAVTGARFLTMRAFRNASPMGEAEHAVWTKYFLAGACAAGAVWGLSGILLFHPSFVEYDIRRFGMILIIDDCLTISDFQTHLFPIFQKARNWLYQIYQHMF